MRSRGTVVELIRMHAPALGADELMDDALALGGDGLGLDSIAIAELLLECEVRFGVRLAHLLESGPLTLGGLVASLDDAPVVQ